MNRIFFIADLHLDHKNIIKYCGRPFKDINDMNDTLVTRWNSIVSKDDTVIFAGDFCKNKYKFHYWLSKLNGEIIMLKGNHDVVGEQSMYHSITFTYNNIIFLVVHDPKDIPEDYNGWIIHGHQHNNDVEKYPLISHNNKTINVSCELIDYTPVLIDDIILMINRIQEII